MKTENLVSKNWDDLVFENRNQEYGAYSIRKSYSDNLLSGAFLSVSFGAFVLLIPLLTSMMRGEDISDYHDPILTELPTNFSVKPIIEIEPQTIQVLQTRTQSLAIPTRMTTEITDDVIPTNIEIVESVRSNPDAPIGEPTVSLNVGVGIIETLPAIVEPSVFIVVEVMPAYDGGLEAMYKFIQKKIRYPAMAQRNSLQGTVFVSFVINASGKVVDVAVARGISPDLDKEAMRVISMLPGWKAGKQHNKNVSVRMTLPIKFQLSNNN